jgi:hypothetical protein
MINSLFYSQENDSEGPFTINTKYGKPIFIYQQHMYSEKTKLELLSIVFSALLRYVLASEYPF